MSRALRILVVDDHELVRRGLKSILETHPNWMVVGEATTGREAIAQAGTLSPDVVILDMSMPELNGLEATRGILKVAPDARVLVLTQHDSEQLVRSFLQAGAQGYLVKSDAARDLVPAVESLEQGRPFFTSKVARMVLDGYLKSLMAEGDPPAALTPSEAQIVQLLAEGKTNKEVAGALSIAVKTVETHRAHIMRKLGFHSVSDLVRYAVRNNMIQP
ncbi:MAG TPA: response regulator transcription factor [Terriglobia bacterium]|nr:response regulator transcription factor [Terriglobia bacterium]